MAGSSSFSFERNRPLFSTEEEDMDRAFLQTTPSSKIDERRMQLLAEKKKIEDRTVQSSMRSISLLRESEDIGIATAEELALQREALQRTERKLDDIKSNLRVSQRHITGIKSIFGSVKNYFSGGKDVVTKSIDEEPPVPRSHSDLSDLIAARNNSTNSNNYEDHPAARRHLDLDHDYDRTSADVDAILDNNLAEMGSALSRLKLLGINLGDAIESDNQLIDRIQAKADSADVGIQRQTKDMERILKK